MDHKWAQTRRCGAERPNLCVEMRKQANFVSFFVDRSKIFIEMRSAAVGDMIPPCSKLTGPPLPLFPPPLLQGQRSKIGGFYCSRLRRLAPLGPHQSWFLFCSLVRGRASDCRMLCRWTSPKWSKRRTSLSLLQGSSVLKRIPGLAVASIKGKIRAN